MPLWEYSDSARATTIEAVSSDSCLFCSTGLCVLHSESHKSGSGPESRKPSFSFRCDLRDIESGGPWSNETKTVVKRCPCCGWWLTRTCENAKHMDHGFEVTTHQVRGAAGCLKALDLTNIQTPLDEVRDFLMASYDARFSIHPRKLEEVVASVFRDLGYDVCLTNYSGDDGIDVILARNNESVGVQVKRYKARIEASQIRELAGSLELGNMTRGIYVTTSTFRSGATHTAARFAMQGRLIELLDADQFYAVLGIAQQRVHDRRDTSVVEEYIRRSVVLRSEKYNERDFM